VQLKELLPSSLTAATTLKVCARTETEHTDIMFGQKQMTVDCGTVSNKHSIVKGMANQEL
jgi:hypothetical protein